MRELNAKQTQIVTGAENSYTGCKTSYGYYYETPTGEVKFLATKIAFADGKVISFGLIPEDWKQISKPTILVEYCSV